MLFAALFLTTACGPLVAPPNAASAPAAEVRTASALAGKIVFRNHAAQAREFIEYNHTINLTPHQEEIKRAALEPMQASCCAGSNAYTCCCPCNLSKTVWGLSNYVIAQHGADAKEVREAVDAWLGYVNPNGSHGDACYKGRCADRLHADGCGGMKEEELEM